VQQRRVLYLFQRQDRDYKIADKDYEVIRDQLDTMPVNRGFPYLAVQDGGILRMESFTLSII